jgi:hypothetical protein
MEPEISRHFSHKPANCPYPKPDQSSPRLNLSIYDPYEYLKKNIMFYLR